MAVANGYGKTTTRGSVFVYDIGDTINSYRGEPTTNHIWHQNPRIDTSYESFMPGSDTGQIAALHPGAIRVYNGNNDDITDYRNTGINVSNSGVDWYNTRHAYWIYDQKLKRPVVRMYNETAVWQAKHFNPGIGSLSNIGVTAGTTYVLSWLQYVENLDRSAWVGLYSYSNTNGYWNFWDGLQAANNTKTHTWERVYAIFTATNNGQLGNYHNGYMYGHAVGWGELRIADVQLEVKTHATQYNNSYTRSSTQGLLPLVGNSTIDLSNISFDSNAKMIFDGTNDYIESTTDLTSLNNLTSGTIELIFKWNGSTSYTVLLHLFAGSSYYGTTLGLGDWTGAYNDESIIFMVNDDIGTNLTAQTYYRNGNFTYRDGLYHHLVVTTNGSIVQMYLDGNQLSLTSTASSKFSPPTVTKLQIGKRDYGGGTGFHSGEIPVVKIYNQTLSAAEVKQNYNSYKTRFNLS